MKYSIAITVKDELEEIKQLIDILNSIDIGYEREIIVVQDIRNPGELENKVKSFLIEAAFSNRINALHYFKFNDDFSELKNFLNSKCSGDYIFNIDADEIPSTDLLLNFGLIIENNQDVIDLFYLPRINVVYGLTQAYQKKWGWHVDWNKDDYENIVNYPDYQGRIYRNSPKIKWINKVHEKIDGAEAFAQFPINEGLDLLHFKKIERQEKQNEHYSKIMNRVLNESIE